VVRGRVVECFVALELGEGRRELTGLSTPPAAGREGEKARRLATGPWKTWEGQNRIRDGASEGSREPARRSGRVRKRGLQVMVGVGQEEFDKQPPDAAKVDQEKGKRCKCRDSFYGSGSAMVFVVGLRFNRRWCCVN
jgi:hypothetical protein